MPGVIINSSKFAKERMKMLQHHRPEFRVKPHLRKWRGKWECIGHGYSSLGYSPKDAYDSWVHYGALLRV